MSLPVVSESAALSVQACVGGLAADTSSTPAAIDLNAWIADQTNSATPVGIPRYISITVETTDLYLLFTTTAAASSSTINAATRVSTAVATASANRLKIPDFVQAGQQRQYVLNPKYPYLHFVTASAAGVVRVFRS